jgi:hypothetical protein
MVPAEMASAVVWPPPNEQTDISSFASDSITDFASEFERVAMPISLG